MTHILTHSGQTINLAAIDHSRVDLLDIAYSLAHTNRFNGHSARPISVAEHSIVVSEIMERHLAVRSPAVLLAGLMHDAHEYLTGDMSQPMKQLAGSVWAQIENRIQHAVLTRFGLWTAFTTGQTAIHAADMHALSTEREKLMHPDGHVWPCQQSHPAIDWAYHGHTTDYTADDWRRMFLDRFQELSFAIDQQHATLTGGDN